MECKIKIVKLKQVLPNGTLPQREHNVRYFYHRTDGCYYMYDEKGCEFNLTTDGNIIAIDKELIVGSESLNEDTLVCIGLRADYVHPSKGVKGNLCGCNCCTPSYIRAWTYMSDLKDYLETGHIKRDYYRVTLVPSPQEGGIVGCSGSAIVPDESSDGFKFTFESGSKVELYAKPVQGYRFKGWKEFHSNEIMSISPNWSFTIKKDMDLIGVFEPITLPEESYYINVNASPVTGGYVVGAGVFPKGTKHSITAAAIKGYHFVHWTDSANRIVSLNLQYDLEITKDETYTALFEIDTPIEKEYQLSVICQPINGGSCSGSGTYKSGTVASIHPIANSNWEIVSVTNNTGSMVQNADGTYSIIMNQDITVTVVFKEKVAPPTERYTINLASDGYSVVKYKISNGSWSVGSSSHRVEVDKGTIISIECVPNANREFTKWTDALGGLLGTTNPFAITVNSDKEFYAVTTDITPPEPDQRKIIISSNEGGDCRWRVSGGTYSAWGSSFTTYQIDGTVLELEARNATGYTFSQWYKSIGESVSINPITVTITGNVNYVAQYNRIPTRQLHVTADAGGKCRVKIGTAAWGEYYAGSKTYTDILDGTTVSVEALADDGYHFVSWADADAPASAVRDIVMTDSKQVQARFAITPPDKYTVSGQYSPNGCASIDGLGQYDNGTTCTVKVNISPGYTLTNVKVNGIIVTLNANNQYSFVVEQNVVVLVTCELIPEPVKRSLTVKTEDETTSQGGVKISDQIDDATLAIETNSNCADGGTYSVSAKPTIGYKFAGWFENGVKISDLQTYSVVMTADKVLVAHFIQEPYLELDRTSVTFEAEGGTQTVNVTSNVAWTVS